MTTVATPAVDPRDNEPASSAQTWALRCALKKDYRGAGLTRGQASKLLDDHNKATGYVKKPKGRAIEPAQG